MVELRQNAKDQSPAEVQARRTVIVAEALYTISKHECPICDAGSMCDTIVHAKHILTLNEILAEAEQQGADGAVKDAHLNGRREGIAQALALIGKVEGEFRTKADGDAEDPAFVLAEGHRKLATMIRSELKQPEGRTQLEIQARNEEAGSLSAYVHEISAQYRMSSNDAVASALDSVADDIAKGSEGVLRLQLASNLDTDPEILAELITDPDPDVRWWAAQNTSTPVEALVRAAGGERHATVLASLIANPHLPAEQLDAFLRHPHPDVAATARRRLEAEEG